MPEAAAGDLPDVNWWVALLAPDHPHHEAAVDYWNGHQSSLLVACSTTLLGALRLLTHAKVMRDHPYAPSEAWQAIASVVAAGVVVIGEPTQALVELGEATQTEGIRSGEITDAYLGLVAKSHGLRVVTFDQSFRALPGVQVEKLAPTGTL